MSDSSDSIYIGDGAYASLTEWGDVIITANHHDPIIATDKVSLDRRAICLLVEWLRSRGAKIE